MWYSRNLVHLSPRTLIQAHGETKWSFQNRVTIDCWGDEPCDSGGSCQSVEILSHFTCLKNIPVPDWLFLIHGWDWTKGEWQVYRTWQECFNWCSYWNKETYVTIMCLKVVKALLGTRFLFVQADSLKFNGKKFQCSGGTKHEYVGQWFKPEEPHHTVVHTWLCFSFIEISEPQTY